jgi:luciferase family oxidoreductase group 1
MLLSALDQSPVLAIPSPTSARCPRGRRRPSSGSSARSGDSAAYAAHFGVAFSFAHFINDEGGAAIVRAYGEYFKPSAALAAPHASVAAFTVCAETGEEASRLARSRDLFLLRLYTGRAGPYPSVEEAESYPYAPHQLAIVQRARRRSITGSPEEVREKLLALAGEYGVDEIVVVTITHSPEARLRSYELLAQAFDLEPRKGAET